MANVVLMERDLDSQRAITSYLEYNGGHTVEHTITTLPAAYEFMGKLIEGEIAPNFDALLLTDQLEHDDLGRRPDFTGPFVSTMPEDLEELRPVDSPGLIKGILGRFRKKPEEPEQSETLTLERMHMGSDAALIAEINRLYRLNIPIVGIAAMKLATRGVVLPDEHDLTTAGWFEKLAPLLNELDQQRELRRSEIIAKVARRGVDAQMQAADGSGRRKTKRREQ